MGCHQADVAEQAARRSSGKRPPRPQWYLLGFKIRSTLGVICRKRLALQHCYNRFANRREQHIEHFALS
jgi:hypothetical protein